MKKVLLVAFVFAIACTIWFLIGFVLDTYIGNWAFRLWSVVPIFIGITGYCLDIKQNNRK